MKACGGPERMLITSPRPQPTPPRSAMPARSITGKSKIPVQKSRWKARSAGEKPTLTPCLAATKPAAQPKDAPAPHKAPIRIECLAAAGCAFTSTAVVPAGDLRLADTLGSQPKSNRENRTVTSPGWKAHGEITQSHYYLCRYRLDPHAVDVAAFAGDRRADRR